MTRKTSFYYSFLILPPPQRRAITAVFDFCRAVDDAVDLETDATRAVAALAMWRREVGLVFDGGQPVTPQGRALQPFAAPFHLPRAQFDALTTGTTDAAPRCHCRSRPYCPAWRRRSGSY